MYGPGDELTKRILLAAFALAEVASAAFAAYCAAVGDTGLSAALVACIAAMLVGVVVVCKLFASPERASRGAAELERARARSMYNTGALVVVAIAVAGAAILAFEGEV